MMLEKQDSSGAVRGSVPGSYDRGNNKPSDSIKAWNFLTSWATVSFSRRALLHAISWSVLPSYCVRNGQVPFSL